MMRVWHAVNEERTTQWFIWCLGVIWDVDMVNYDLNYESLVQRQFLCLSFSSRAGFLNVDIIAIWGLVSLCLGGRPVHFRMRVAPLASAHRCQ